MNIGGKMDENKFDFKFLNKVMYVCAFIIICFALKEFGLLDKIVELLLALTPFYIGVVICWISKPLANRLRKLGISKGLAATILQILLFLQSHQILLLLCSYYIISLMLDCP